MCNENLGLTVQMRKSHFSRGHKISHKKLVRYFPSPFLCFYVDPILLKKSILSKESNCKRSTNPPLRYLLAFCLNFKRRFIPFLYGTPDVGQIIHNVNHWLSQRLGHYLTKISHNFRASKSTHPRILTASEMSID